MLLEEFSYHLPLELIAQEPIEPRDASRLLILPRFGGQIEHRYFYDLPAYLKPGDVLVINNTRVLPARLYGRKETTGTKIEVLLLKEAGPQSWEVLAKPARRLPVGTRIIFGQGELTGEVLASVPGGGRILRFTCSDEGDFKTVLAKLGQVPLPPYIRRPLDRPERYQTVYARREGSAAAPTAGLHFTPELLARIREQGVQVAELLLHVGLDTFRPVKEENIEEHRMHSEYYAVEPGAAAAINKARCTGGRVIAVGTTVVRVLETVAHPDGRINPSAGWTDLFIYPGYRFKAVDCLITNFHLPRSTLLMLVCAFAGRERVLAAYREAIRERYRFFSFGDAMLIV